MSSGRGGALRRDAAAKLGASGLASPRPPPPPPKPLTPLEKLIGAVKDVAKTVAGIPEKIGEAVKQGVKDVKDIYQSVQDIAKEYDPELALRAGIEGVIHTGTSWLAKIPVVGGPASSVIDKLFSQPPPVTSFPTTPPPLSANPPLDGDLAQSKYVSTDELSLFGADGVPNLPGDVRQVGLGDCYFMASVAGLDPKEIDGKLIQDNHDGTYTVRLFDVASNGEVTPAYVRVSGELPQPPGADYNADGKWVAIVEKAYAAHLGSYDQAGGNNNPKFFAAPSVLTGRPTVAYALPISDPDVVFERLQKSTAEDRTAFAGFYGENHDGLYGNHAYTVESVRIDEATGQRYVTLRNPWGKSELGADGKPRDGVDDGVFEMPLEEFMKTYQAVAVAGG